MIKPRKVSSPGAARGQEWVGDGTGLAEYMRWSWNQEGSCQGLDRGKQDNNHGRASCFDITIVMAADLIQTAADFTLLGSL